MKEIPLTQGKVALIDDEDFELVSQYTWCAHKGRISYYALTNIRINKRNVTLPMHRLILGLKYGDPRQVDHQNHDTLNNQKHNIRICNHSQNQANRIAQKNGTSKFKGVYWYKRTKRWMARIWISGSTRFLGYFINEHDAALAYDVAAKKYFGEFAYLNFN